MKITQRLHNYTSLAASAAFTLIIAMPALAASATWTGTTDATWSSLSGPNWTPSVPGATTGVANADTATFNLANPPFGLTGNPVVIDPNRNIKSITFDTAAGAYVIGATGGNALLLSAAGTIQNASTLVSGNTETVNAPLTLEGNYTISNNAANPNSLGSSALVIGGNITAAVNSTLSLTGTNTSSSNVLSGTLAPGAGTLAITKSGVGSWDITGTNSSYIGTTTINTGTLSLGNSNALGSGTIVLNGGSLAADQAVSLTNNISVITAGSYFSTYYAGLAGSNNISTSGNLTFTGSSSILQNNLTNGATFTVTGTTYLANSPSATAGAAFVGPGNYSLSTIDGGTGLGSGIASAFVYNGTGTLTLNGTMNATGTPSLLGGTVILNEGSASAGTLLNSSASLFLGDNLVLSGGAGTFETVNGTTVANNSAAVYAASISATNGNTIYLGTLTGGSTSTILFQSGVAYTTSASGAPNATAGETGIFGGWAIASTGSGSSETYDFATDLTGTAGTETAIVAYPQADYNLITASNGAPSGGGINLFTDTTGVNFTNTGYGNIGSLKIDTGASTAGGSLTFARSSAPLVWYGGNLLYTGASNFSVGGNLWYEANASATTYDIEQYGTGALTINSVLDGPFSSFTSSGNAITGIAANVAGGVIKSGPGKLTLTAANNYVGNTYIDQGTLAISSDSNLGGIAGDLTVTSATNGSTAVTVTGVAGNLNLVGTSLLGSTVKSVSIISGGSISLVLSSAYTGTTINSTTNPSGVTYAYANGQQSLFLDGTLETTATMNLGESYTDATTGTVSNSRTVYLGIDGGTFQVDGTTALTVGGTVQPQAGSSTTYTDSLTKTGTGTLVLSGNNLYAGGTTVSAGTLLANTTYVAGQSSTGQGSVTVANGATLGGKGVIAPDGVTGAISGQATPGTDPGASVIIQSGGILAPGGVQTSGTAPNGNLTLVANATTAPNVLDLLSGAKLLFSLGTNLGVNASSELVLSINLPGEVVFNGNTVNINDLTAGTGGFLAGNYILVTSTTANAGGTDYAGLTLNGSNQIIGGLSLSSTFTSYYTGSYLYLDTTTGNIDLSVTPEPSSWALMLGGLALLVFYQRKRFSNLS